MKILNKIATLLFLILSIGLYCQNKLTIDLNDIIEISENYGIDSALNRCNIPIYLLPTEITRQLYEKAIHSQPSKTIDEFIENYSNVGNKSNVDNEIGIIQLDRSYDNIGEINLDNYAFMRNILANYLESECSQIIKYYNNIGFLDVQCVYGPLNGHGALYKLELKQDKLIVYQIKKWIS